MITGVDIDGDVRDIEAAELLPLLDEMTEEDRNEFLAACSLTEIEEIDAAIDAANGEADEPEAAAEFEQMEAQAHLLESTKGAYQFGVDELERRLGRKLTSRERTGVAEQAAEQALATRSGPDVNRAFERYYEDRGETPYNANTGTGDMARHMVDRLHDMEAATTPEPEEEEREPMPEFPAGPAGDADRNRYMADRLKRLSDDAEQPEEVAA